GPRPYGSDRIRWYDHPRARLPTCPAARCVMSKRKSATNAGKSNTAYGVVTRKAHPKAARKSADDFHADAPLLPSLKISTCATTRAATMAAPLYFAEAARPPATPATANHRSASSLPGGPSLNSTARSRQDRETITNSVINTSVMAK